MNRSIHPATGLALSAFVLTLFSCGGGGGGGGSTTDPYAGLNQLKVDVALASTGISIDPLNIFPGDNVIFRVAGRTSTGALAYVNGTGWSSTAPSSAGFVADNGSFTALSPSTPFSASIVVNGSTLTTSAQTVAIQAILSGRIRTVDGFGVSGVTIIYYNSAGTEIGRAKSATDGRVRFSVPTTATKFKLDFAAVDPAASRYVRQFAYDGIDYSTVISGCYATLPALTNGSTSLFASDIVIYPVLSTTPPPPPDGCNP